MTYPTIERLPDPPGATVGTTSSTGIALDTSVASPHVIFKSDGSATDSGIRSMSVSSRTQVAEATIVDIYGSASPNQIASPICITPTGQIVTIGRGWLNGTAQLSLLDKDTFGLIGAWNDVDAGPGPATLPFAPSLPQSLGATAKGSTSFIIAPETATEGGTVNVLQAGATGGGTIQFAGHSFDVDEDAAVSCGSPATVGKFFTLGYDTDVSSNPVGVYVTTVGLGAAGYDNSGWSGTPNANIATTKLGNTIAPPEIDSGWTNISAITQPGYDKSDGNLLAFFQTTDVVADKSYLVKINSTTGVVMWATAVSDINERFFAMGASNIDGGVFAYLSGTRILYVFDTSDGSITSQTTLSVGGGISNRNSIYDYATNRIFFYGQWASSATPPYPVGGITPAGEEYWYALQLGDEPSVALTSCCEDPVIVDQDVIDLLGQRALRVAYLLQLDFKTTPQYLWSGHYSLMVGGHTWQAIPPRLIGGIEGLEEAADMSSTQMKFMLSGVDAATLALAIGEGRDEYVGHLDTVWLQFFNAMTAQPVGEPIARSAGIMDGIEISRARDGDQDKQNSVRTLTLTAESIFYGRGVPPASNYTERDQKFRSEGDRGLDFVNEVQNVVMPIPW